MDLIKIRYNENRTAFISRFHLLNIREGTNECLYQIFDTFGKPLHCECGCGSLQRVHTANIDNIILRLTLAGRAYALSTQQII